MSRFIESTQLAELVNVAIGIVTVTIILICARLLRSAARRLRLPPGNRTRRDGKRGAAVAPKFFMDRVTMDWPSR